MSESLQKDETPSDLKIFYGGEDQHFKNSLEMQDLDDMKKFTDLLTTQECACDLTENKISIHLKTGNIYFTHQNS